MKGLAFLSAGPCYTVCIFRPGITARCWCRIWPARPNATRWRRWGSAWRCWDGGLPPLAVSCPNGRSLWPVPDPQYLAGTAGGFRRAEQCAFAGLLRAAGQCTLPPGASDRVQKAGRLPWAMLVPILILSLAWYYWAFGRAWRPG